MTTLSRPLEGPILPRLVLHMPVVLKLPHTSIHQTMIFRTNSTVLHKTPQLSQASPHKPPNPPQHSSPRISPWIHLGSPHLHHHMNKRTRPPQNRNKNNAQDRIRCSLRTYRQPQGTRRRKSHMFHHENEKDRPPQRTMMMTDPLQHHQNDSKSSTNAQKPSTRIPCRQHSKLRKWIVVWSWSDERKAWPRPHPRCHPRPMPSANAKQHWGSPSLKVGYTPKLPVYSKKWHILG